MYTREAGLDVSEASVSGGGYGSGEDEPTRVSLWRVVVVVVVGIVAVDTDARRRFRYYALRSIIKREKCLPSRTSFGVFTLWSGVLSYSRVVLVLDRVFILFFFSSYRRVIVAAAVGRESNTIARVVYTDVFMTRDEKKKKNEYYCITDEIESFNDEKTRTVKRRVLFLLYLTC